MAKGTFGESLKREREMRGVSLDEISSATRIATRFLRAIEEERWDQLPGGVFNRGFVRAVARYLGLDEENVVAEYALAVGDRQSVPVWTGSPPAVAPKQPWLAWTLVACLVIAVAASGWFGTRRVLAWHAARRAARNAAAAPSVATPEGQATAGPDDAVLNLPATSNAPANAEETTVPTDVAEPANPEPGAAVAAPESDEFELKIESGKKTKVVVEADSNRVFDGTIEAGENHTFTAKERFDVSSRDAGALVLELNGKALPPIGPTGHSGKTTITREALKGATGGGN